MRAQIMNSRRLLAFLGAALVGAATNSTCAAQDPLAWASDVDAEGAIYGDSMHYDSQFTLAQAADEAAPARSRTSSRTARSSRVPYMIGDSPSSSSSSLGASFGIQGIPNVASAEHPIFGGGKFNAAENAISFPTDRIYANYRHFSGAHDVSVLGQQSTLPVDRCDFGFEKTALDGMTSIELRVPVTRQLGSDTTITSDSINGIVGLDDRDGELGNLALNFKLLLLSRQAWGVSCGLGVNCPTGEDAYIDMFLDEPDLAISPTIGTTTPTDISLVGQFKNETVNLVPYLAWFVRPGRLFHQGFLQIDTPAQPFGRTSARVGHDHARLDLRRRNIRRDSNSAKSISRRSCALNVGLGYWLCQGERGGPLRGVAALFEAHYTTALDNANPFVVPVTTLSPLATGPADVPLSVVAGPGANNVDIVNLTARRGRRPRHLPDHQRLHRPGERRPRPPVRLRIQPADEPPLLARS